MLINTVKEFLEDWNNGASKLPKKFEDFLDLDIYAFGINEQSQSLAEAVSLKGYIDDFTSEEEHNGQPIIKLENLATNKNDFIVINCVLNAKPRTAIKRLESVGIKNFFNYSELNKAYKEISLPEFVEQTRSSLLNRGSEWVELYDRLNDNASRKVLKDVLRYRVSGDPSLLSEYDFRPKDQYFEDFMEYSEEVFVDAGGFTGDTTEEFCLRYPDYKKVYLFEPNPNNLKLAKERLTNFSDIEFIEKGVSDTETVLRFFEDGSASIVSDNGDISIPVVPIDSAIKSEISLIKMDLEGWESHALKGAEKHILEDHPKLAIAVYHHPNDFLDLSKQILNIRDDYDIYLRHYTESWIETIMYFKPKS
ncbi:FkbM family methyltransferase [Pseudoalteromonas sp. G4]|uniref:FkbM family methyltransferase n=1 Tax=Pseudoalteromonas sp. G4 TaxID=2992761 RepID=UPI00237D8A55|nr:FkbM family methyltransferase [Pseudoalteromonas sp. G4]MDE3271243.1 FkbM family methyltransferase [Pseudoalteromonas sp. G4]